MKRVDKINYYLDIAQTVAARGTCLRRNFGAIIVKNDEIISIARNEEKDDDKSAENAENATVDATVNEGTAQSSESAVEAPAETNAESGDGENVEA